MAALRDKWQKRGYRTLSRLKGHQRSVRVSVTNPSLTRESGNLLCRYIESGKKGADLVVIVVRWIQLR